MTKAELMTHVGEDDILSLKDFINKQQAQDNIETLDQDEDEDFEHHWKMMDDIEREEWFRAFSNDEEEKE